MKDRIKEILTKEKITSAQFADKIGVQRSSISHILSGRNKPGFDFIQKIILSFPALDAGWLITGKGSMYTKNERPADLFAGADATRDNFTREAGSDEVGMSTPEPDKSVISSDILSELHDRKIEKILVFYSDKTFREYKPER
jgi:transcriptional regulator with XRE-family HTH domain